ncbi:MAG: hypothetical protein NVS3B25_07500 [Hymenobacter sp.]
MLRERLINNNRTRWHIMHNEKHYKFRSGFEYIYATHLIRSGVEFEFEPRWFKFSPTCRYCPDFYLPQTDEWIEIKGYYNEQQGRKHEMLRQLGYKLTILFEKDIANMIDGGFSLSYFYRNMAPLMQQNVVV